MTPKDLFNKIKAAFSEPVIVPAAAAVVMPTPTVFKLKDGTEVTIAIEDPAINMAPDAGDPVTINGVAATEGEYEFEDGSKITVDALGMVVNYTPVEPVTQVDLSVVQPLKFEAIASQDELNKLYAAFATGTPEERIVNLETMCRAMMDYCFGYQIREAQTKSANESAIAIYKNDLSTAQTAVTTASLQLSKHEQTIKSMFELVEKLVDEPSADPKTLPESKRETFESKKEERLQARAESLAKAKQTTRPYIKD